MAVIYSLQLAIKNIIYYSPDDYLPYVSLVSPVQSYILAFSVYWTSATELTEIYSAALCHVITDHDMQVLNLSLTQRMEYNIYAIFLCTFALHLREQLPVGFCTKHAGLSFFFFLSIFKCKLAFILALNQKCTN